MKTILHKSRKLLRKIEVDRAVFFGILTKVWSIIAGPLTALLIILKFNPELQGYYYTFSSLLALQVFVELGLGTVIIQFASHEWSKLRFDDQGGITGDKHALSRLVSLANITSKWYLVGGLIIAFGLGLGGYIFLRAQASNISWQLPWFALCFFTGVSVCLIPAWSLLEGCNQVSVVYTYRFIQGIVTNLTIWIVLFFGAKLWTPSISVLVTILFAFVFFRYKYWRFIKELFFSKPMNVHIEWLREIFPMQWRIALSWISGYFIFSLFTPVLFRYHGPIIAGQFGMTWSIIGGIGAIAGSWLLPRVPQFGMLIARNEYQKLDQLFLRTTKIFILVALTLFLFVWLAIYILYQTGNHFSQRILSPLPAGLFIIAQIISVLTFPLSFYLRAHKKEPLLWISLFFGLMVGSSIFIFGRFYGVVGMAMSYLVANLFVTPIVVIIWYRCRKEWHRENIKDKKISLLKEYYYKRFKEKGFLYCAGKAIYRILYSFICYVTGILVYLICRLWNIKFVFLGNRAIGHLCVEMDCYIKEGLLGLRPKYNTILIAPLENVSNVHLLKYWKKYFKVIYSPLLCFLLKPLAKNPFTGYQTFRFAFSIKGAYYPQIQRMYHGRPALLSLTEDDYKFGWASLRKIGIPEGAWFVCVHCREDGYLGDVNQSLRNADIGNYLLAIEVIVKRGGWVIRMGDSSMKPLPVMGRVIDYAHMNIKSEQMDVFLCASCRFFLGSHSGLYHLANVFGISAATANHVNLIGTLTYGTGDIGIPKLIWSKKLNRYLNFKEILELSAGNLTFDHLFVQAGLQPMENSPEDIKELVVEMLEKTEGEAVYSAEDELLQKRFKALMNPDHYSFGAISRVGRDFLRKYNSLLED